MIGKVVHLDAWFDNAMGRVEGYAAPVGEIAACTIYFRNGGHLMAAARAVHFVYSEINFRAGWCGFSLPIVPSLFLFDDRLDLCCGASGNILLTLSLEDIGGDWALAPAGKTAARVVDFLSARRDVMSVDALVPVFMRIIDRKGAVVAAEAMYQMLLRRQADPAGLASVMNRLKSRDVELAMKAMIWSDEYAALPMDRRLLSPFDYGAPPEVILALVD